MPGTVDTMIGDPVLGVVVGADFFGSLAGADGLGPGGIQGGHFLVLFSLPEFLTEKFESNFFVALLVAFFPDSDDITSGNVGKADGSTDFVDVLPARSAGAGEGPIQILVFDINFFGSDLGEDGDSGCRGVDAPLGLGFGDTLDAVNAGFVFEGGIGS